MQKTEDSLISHAKLYDTLILFYMSEYILYGKTVIFCLKIFKLNCIEFVSKRQH